MIPLQVTVALLTALATPARAPLDSVAIGKPAPVFNVKDVAGKDQDLTKYKGQWVVLEWMNPSCPAVKGYYTRGAMQALQKKYTDKKVVWLSINSSAPGREGHVGSEEASEWMSKQNSSATAMILDEAGTLGHQFGAQVTPTIFIINPNGELAYRGAVDKPGKPDDKDAKNYVASALDEGMAGKPITDTSTRPRG